MVVLPVSSYTALVVPAASFNSYGTVSYNYKVFLGSDALYDRALCLCCFYVRLSIINTRIKPVYFI